MSTSPPEDEKRANFELPLSLLEVENLAEASNPKPK